MCQCLKFVYFSPVQDVTVLVHLQGSTSSLRRTSTPVPGRPAPETPAGGGELHLRRCRNHVNLSTGLSGYSHFWPFLAIIGPLLTITCHYWPLLATGWSGYSKHSESPLTQLGGPVTNRDSPSYQPGVVEAFNKKRCKQITEELSHYFLQMPPLNS